VSNTKLWPLCASLKEKASFLYTLIIKSIGDIMAIIGFHFKKMSAEKKKSATGKINVKNNLKIVQLKEAKVNMGSSKQAGLEFTFDFKAVYEPDIAVLNLVSAAVFLGSDTVIKETLAKWQKEKKLPGKVMEEVYNHILAKCNVQSLILARDMQLPPHIQLPRVSAK
jgi:hypothetical protein